MALPAPGDVRHCLVAMADSDGNGAVPLVDALEFRFEGTDVAGHALGNLLLAGLAAVTGDFVAAVDEASRLVGLDPEVARVLPATAEPVVLRASVAGDPGGDPGGELTGQVAISRAGGIERVAVEPGGARAPAAAVEALVDADQIVLGPGSLFTSVLAAAVVDDVRRGIADSRGRVVYVCNLRGEGTETFGYDVAGHVAALRRHGIAPDVVVAQAGGLPLGDLGGPSGPGARGTGSGIEVVEADVARPSGLAHDSVKLAEVLAQLVP
jgi:uncharacterized cofD-like protein